MRLTATGLTCRYPDIPIWDSFSNQLVTDRLFENDYGYLKKDNLQVIVSAGYGTWGPPIRIGNTPEIVHICVRFTGSER